MMTYEGSPMASQAPLGYAKKILHAGLTLGDGVLEGCDASLQAAARGIRGPASGSESKSGAGVTR